jgi:hypothetical protein
MLYVSSVFQAFSSANRKGKDTKTGVECFLYKRQTSGRKISKYLIIAYEKHLKRELCCEENLGEKLFMNIAGMKFKLINFPRPATEKMAFRFSKHSFCDTFIRQSDIGR